MKARQGRWLAAAAALLVVAGTAWMGWRAAQARGRQGNAPSAATPSGPPATAPARVIVLAVAPGRAGAEGAPPRVTLPPDAIILRLVLTLPARSAHSLLTAALTSAEGAPVWSGRPATAADGAPTVTVDVPARQIPKGDYELRLKRPGLRGLEEIAVYAFTVLRD